MRDRDSLLCVGLDPDPVRIPRHLTDRSDAIFEFCRAIVDATADLVCAFKPQIAYFAAQRAEEQLEALIAHIHQAHPGVPVILDAKRGDIGPTAIQYAREAFERYRADAVTLSPYMGRDSITPWLEWPDRGIFLLCRTSNPGGSDLQSLAIQGRPLFERVAHLASKPLNQGGWGAPGRVGLVVGATFPGEIERVRNIVGPDMPLLIPGIGAQGGDLDATIRAAGPSASVINSSRDILYAGTGEDFDQAARAAATTLLDSIRTSIDTSIRDATHGPGASSHTNPKTT
jgi:orotidine-5'-phosphate decarboxylase